MLGSQTCLFCGKCDQVDEGGGGGPIEKSSVWVEAEFSGRQNNDSK